MSEKHKNITECGKGRNFTLLLCVSHWSKHCLLPSNCLDLCLLTRIERVTCTFSVLWQGCFNLTTNEVLIGLDQFMYLCVRKKKVKEEDGLLHLTWFLWDWEGLVPVASLQEMLAANGACLKHPAISGCRLSVQFLSHLTWSVDRICIDWQGLPSRKQRTWAMSCI